MKGVNKIMKITKAYRVEMLSICVLLNLFLITFPTPFQYFVIFIVNFFVQISLQSRVKIFIDFAVFSLVIVVLAVVLDEVYIAQKIGVFIFYLLFNIILSEVKNDLPFLVNPPFKALANIFNVHLKIFNKVIEVFKANKILLLLVTVLVITVALIRLVQSTELFCIKSFT